MRILNKDLETFKHFTWDRLKEIPQYIAWLVLVDKFYVIKTFNDLDNEIWYEFIIDRRRQKIIELKASNRGEAIEKICDYMNYKFYGVSINDSDLLHTTFT